MASTFTNSLKIEKPGNGDQPNTWGTTVNTNFDKIEAATKGMVSVNLTTNQTLQLDQSQVGTADYQTLYLHGSFGGDRELNLPAVTASYDILVRASLNSNVLAIQVDGNTSADAAVSVSGTYPTAFRIACDGTRVYNITNTQIFSYGMILPFFTNGGTQAIPTGWQICDGTNGTPDLRNKFVKAAASIGAEGTSAGGTSTVVTTGQISVEVLGSTVLASENLPAINLWFDDERLINTNEGAEPRQQWVVASSQRTSPAGGINTEFRVAGSTSPTPVSLTAKGVATSVSITVPPIEPAHYELVHIMFVGV